MVVEPVLRYLVAEGGWRSLDEIADALGVPKPKKGHLALSLKDSAKDHLVAISRRAEDDFQYRYGATARCRDLLAWVDGEGTQKVLESWQNELPPGERSPD